MKKYILIFSLLGFSSFTLLAQTISHNQNAWLHYVGTFHLTKKTSTTFEATMRYTNGFTEKQQYFIRPSFDYQLNKYITGSIGFTHYTTYVYGSPAINKRPTPENHVWLQFVSAHQVGSIKLTNRLRNEFRFVGIATPTVTNPLSQDDYVIQDYTFRDRFRYMFLATVPLYRMKNQQKVVGILGDEAFINIGKLGSDVTKNEVGNTRMNQNRIISGLGYIFNARCQVQVAYIHQTIWNFPNTIRESNPTVRTTLITKI